MDFFGEISFDDIDTSILFGDFKSVVAIRKSKNINIFSINNIKVDFVSYSYPWLEDQLCEDGIRLAKPEDISAMKLAAITGRGSKKDFVDIYFLLKRYTLQEMLDFYTAKYFDGSEYMVLKSLSYFDDADMDHDVFMINEIEWETIKNTILKTLVLYNKSLI